jgi:hypothetical protein
MKMTIKLFYQMLLVRRQPSSSCTTSCDDTLRSRTYQGLVFTLSQHRADSIVQHRETFLSVALIEHVHTGHVRPGHTCMPASIETCWKLEKPILWYSCMLSDVASMRSIAVIRGLLLARHLRELEVATVQSLGCVYRSCVLLLTKAAGRTRASMMSFSCGARLLAVTFIFCVCPGVFWLLSVSGLDPPCFWFLCLLPHPCHGTASA